VRRDPEWYRNRTEICLFRFCDLYELIEKENIDWGKVREILSRNKLNVPVFFALKILSILFTNSVPESFLADFNFDDRLIDKYYDKNGQIVYWKGNLLERLFCPARKYQEIIEHTS
jgi:hypothetical protein